ncbi:DUF1688-domain-containing protein [Thelephora ganbajun]|uniref:DUF1688-domain-containing protein n=1 Tax=Thelephora ganbajun TaxID=370292 RepID=A0ACB6ZVX8_THEGA|nr:DUF1688-domain-containing protein [Thelephora ganbajun]
MPLYFQRSTPELKAQYLLTLPAIRDRCSQVHDLAKEGKLEYFEYHPENEEKVADFCLEIIQRDFQTNYASIPPHGRWRHIDAGLPRVEPLLERWRSSPNPPSDKEIVRRLIDLFLVSVLLDAGAGNAWSYTEASNGQRFARSEGLGVASVHMFIEGLFSGDPDQPHQVDAKGLASVTIEKIATAFQVTESNPMVGLEGRTSLLVNLSKALSSNPGFFGLDTRPGNIVDFLEKESKELEGKTVVPISALWHALITGLSVIWPSRLSLAGISLGDVWPCTSLKNSLPKDVFEEGDDLVPFHKLTGWTTYSLLEPMEKMLGWKFDGINDMTGLPEYRNGGLLVDLGVLSIKPSSIPTPFYPNKDSPIPKLPPSHPAIVEWRAMTVIELDRIAALIRHKVGVSPEASLTLAQILESATWKGGREIARQRRPETGGPPIEIESDGTVF